MNLSYWEQASFFKNIDVAVIGSGIVGLNAAIHLKEQYPKLNIVILEKGSLPSGASTRNAGFACFGSVSELADDLQKMGLDDLLSLVEWRWKGLQKLRSRIGDHRLNYLNYGGYEIFLEQKHFERYNDYIEFFNQELASIIGSSDIFQIQTPNISSFGFKKVKQLILNTAESQINTGAMMKAFLQIAKDLEIPIYNGIEIKKFQEEKTHLIIETEQNWHIKTQQVILATNGFTQKLLPQLNVLPARNQVLITKPIKNLTWKGTFHYDSGYYYFRNVGNRVLFGGARNLALEAETTHQFGTTPLIQNQLIEMLQEVILPETSFEIDQWWSGILGVGTSKTPIVERLNDKMVIAVKLSGIGVAIGSLIGEEAAKLAAAVF